MINNGLRKTQTAGSRSARAISDLAMHVKESLSVL